MTLTHRFLLFLLKVDVHALNNRYVELLAQSINMRREAKYIMGKGFPKKGK